MAVLNFDIKSVALASGESAKAVFLTGSIDASTNQTFESRLTDILGGGTRNVLLVLTNVKYINSTGLGTIVKCVDTFREKQGDIKLVGVPTKVIALFEMLGLLALFETHDTIEKAVESFDKSGNGKATAAPANTAKFPLQFKHPVTGLGLNVSQPGRFKDPRSGDYFSIDAAGTVEFYGMTKVSLAELHLPVGIPFASILSSLVTAIADRAKLSAEVVQAVTSAIATVDELVRPLATDANEAITLLVVGDPEKLSVGFMSHGLALNFAGGEAAVKTLEPGIDQVKHLSLPGRGFLLTLTKRA